MLSRLRIGQGYDVHALVEGRKLILGGVDVPHTKGLLGHSDADVLTHAVADALLGGIRGGDIGKLFPDTDPAYKGADSLKLLSVVLGAVIYYVVIQAILSIMKLNANYLKLMSALIVAVFLAIPHWKNRYFSGHHHKKGGAK